MLSYVTVALTLTSFSGDSGILNSDTTTFIGCSTPISTSSITELLKGKHFAVTLASISQNAVWSVFFAYIAFDFTDYVSTKIESSTNLNKCSKQLAF